MEQQQHWSAEYYATHAGFVAKLGSPVAELLNARPGERVLDLGCGEGTLTEELSRSGAEVIGVDPSDDMLKSAKSRGLDVFKGDAENLTFNEEFDAVFSNAALHWVKDLEKAAASVFRSLRSGGRFVGEFGGAMNVSSLCSVFQMVAKQRGVALEMSWNFPTADEWQKILESAGFTVQESKITPRPTPLPSGMMAWLNTFCSPMLEQFPEASREEVAQEVVEALRWSHQDKSGNWTMDYVRLRFSATKKLE